MKVYKTRPKQVEHAIKWGGFNALEFEEILAGYGYFVKQYDNQLKIGIDPCSFKMLDVGEWVVVLEGKVYLFTAVNFGRDFEEVEI
jgi:hypothetical protein